VTALLGLLGRTPHRRDLFWRDSRRAKLGPVFAMALRVHDAQWRRAFAELDTEVLNGSVYEALVWWSTAMLRE
jgi:hypothetical protein